MEAVEFIPELGDLYFTLVGCTVLIAVMIFLAFRASRAGEADPRRRVLLPMLAYFGALLALMALLGAFWTLFKYPNVTIDATTLTIGKEAYPIPNLANVRMEAVGRGANTDETVLLIQTKDRKNWAFPGDRYDVRKMYGLLRAAD
ncbi:Na+/H+-dicarboxylate symporter [Lewinella aquimaris]|uniref:Na+/H+-dicarboxylate symporter n=1 Tax=Neolewinella aquimaris TaxID=1835722 RepID=A0A840E0N1_9BACT|nr:hypothetical protein [Neolewinella aquimaris]MBB4077503.1 Na+/H+-dicarboxylate symporter [Neolewinella aquimaris]